MNRPRRSRDPDRFGRAYNIPQAFLDFSPTVSLLEAVVASLPSGVVVRFDTPIGCSLEFFRENGRKVKDGRWSWHWELVHDPRAGTLSKLITFARDRGISGTSDLATSIRVIDANGRRIAHIDMFDYYSLWLSDDLDDATVDRILEAVT